MWLLTWVKSEKYVTPLKTNGKKRVRYSKMSQHSRSGVRWGGVIWLFCYLNHSWYIIHCFDDRATNWQNHFITQNLNTTTVLSDYGDSHFLPCRMTRHRKGNNAQRWVKAQIFLAISFINSTAFLFFPFPQPGIWILYTKWRSAKPGAPLWAAEAWADTVLPGVILNYHSRCSMKTTVLLRIYFPHFQTKTTATNLNRIHSPEEKQ